MKLREERTASKTCNVGDSGSNWIVYNADGSKFATAHYDKDEKWWQVFRGQGIGSGRSLDTALSNIEEL